jgi:hypothetical protein
MATPFLPPTKVTNGSAMTSRDVEVPLNPTDAVKDVLVTSGVTDLMPIVATESGACDLIG